MFRNSGFALILPMILLSSCQTFQREPASLIDNGMPLSLARLYDSEVNLQIQEDQLMRAQKAQDREKEDSLSKSVQKLQEQKKVFQEQSSSFTSKSAHGDSPRTFSSTMHNSWGVKEEEMTLGDLSYYIKGLGQPRFFSMGNINAGSYELLLRHETYSRVASSVTRNDDEQRDAQKYLEARIRCDGPFALKTGLFKADQYGAFQSAKFNWYDAKLNGQKVRFRPSAEVKSCDVMFKDPWGDTSKEYTFQLKTEKEKLGYLQNLARTYEACVFPSNAGLTKPQQFFLSSNFTSMNCPLSADSLTTLEDPEEGLQAKVEMLLGQRLPQKFLTEKNPFLPLDMSKAPKLDAIFVSYLVYRSDFYGNVLARLIKYHADHGAQVRILISDVITLKKDQAMFEKMASENGNIKVVQYRYDNAARSGGKLHEFHRTNHVKIFLTLSSTDPSANRVVLGGRNIHDGFLFRAAPNFTSFPSLVNYSKGEESFVHWRDFEFLIKSKTFAEKLAVQYYALWMQDSDTFNVRPTTAQSASSARPDPQYFADADTHPLIRHYVSIPFKDNRNLEDYYAELINHASKKILISTPYFRPLKKVGEALKNAAARGVKITLITRLDLEGDTADFILGAVNKDGVNKFKDTVKIYEYIEPKIILHSKLVMIDDEMSFIGSVNLNKRSFIHDMENGALIYSPAFTKKMTSIYNGYLKLSRPITEKQKVHFWQRAIIGMFDSEF
ncbi:phospholipase D-like domain-containing protein [Bdellovibrio sp. HCB-162]|uniref:phospholipase D-like domain-containing protein n=1 Tax=Bdellovibrio sp. HCB-162 TaxID=3394234 RepID=UPI0039BC5CF0